MDGTPLTGPPLIVTADADLLDELLRLCAAAAVTPEVVDDPGAARRLWWQAAAVLVGSDRAAAVAAQGLGRRDGVVLVCTGPATSTVWQRGVELHADQVVVLPDGQSWLVDQLSDTADGAASPAVTVGVIGGNGGAGASTFAAALALTAAKQGEDALLVDADPLGGGAELVVGCEEVDGLRWREVSATQGRVSGAAFRSALPTVDGLAVLSWGRGEHTPADPATMRAMLGAGQRGSDLVVVDLPRRLDDAATEALLASGGLLMVATADVRAVASTARMLRTLRTLCTDIRLVVRKGSGSDLSPDAVEDSLQVPVIASLATQRSVERSVNTGLGPLSRGGLARACRSVLAAAPAWSVSSR